MPKKIPQSKLDSILHALSIFPEGASLENILKFLDEVQPKRSLQRHLAHLLKHGFVITEGKGRGVRYRLTPSNDEKAELNKAIIPFSSLAVTLEKIVLLPQEKRSHVGYNREFLDSYRPNTTFYLPREVRDRLFELGKSPNGDRPAGTYARKIFSRLLIDLSWNSSRLEGNTYSLLETERLLNLGEESEGKDFKEAQMILNHKAAIEFLVESAEDIGINRYTVFNLHALLANNLLSDPKACGRLRSIPVGIAKSVYHPLEVPQLISEQFTQILDTAKAISNPFEQAFFLMVHLPYLQPFEDVNKRVSRLACNIPLIKHNLCPLSFVDVPENTYINSLLVVYELNRIEVLREVFVWAYERSCQLYSAARKVLGEPDPFRLRYRNLVFETVASIVRGRKDKKLALVTIRETAQNLVPKNDQGRFIEVVENELMSLHEGNIARYRLLPSEFRTWEQIWH